MGRTGVWDREWAIPQPPYNDSLTEASEITIMGPGFSVSSSWWLGNTISNLRSHTSNWCHGVARLVRASCHVIAIGGGS